jgi:hypothetical protein
MNFNKSLHIFMKINIFILKFWIPLRNNLMYAFLFTTNLDDILIINMNFYYI